MWGPLAILLLVAAVSADYEHAWKSGSEYQYLVRSRTLTGLDELSNQYSGILVKALLTVQPQDTQTLRAKVSRPQYAHVHKKLEDGWESRISDQMLELRDLPMTGKPFEIKMKHGVIRDIVTDRDVPTWEVNMLKGIVSQLQVDTQGENAIRSRSNQAPNDQEPYGMYKAMEDSVGGKCEVIYDITPLSLTILDSKPELVPLPNLMKDGQHIDIIKTKNYSRCEQRMDYHFGITGKTNWEPGSNDNGKMLTKSSNSRIVITGDLKRFTIQSSVTTNKMFVSPRMYQHSGVVMSRMNLTLVSVKEATNKLPVPRNPESTGNLVYTYNNPFAEDEHRRPGRPSIARNSKESEGVSSSEEGRQNAEKRKRTGSSSADSDSVSSSEEGNFWQPKPTLEDAPQNPLLPLFIGNKGKAVGMSDKIDPVKESTELVWQIANEIEDPSHMHERQTLEKFTILTSLIRTMSRKQIHEVERNMHLSPNELRSNDKSQMKKQTAWSVIRDSISQAGTGPALLIIKDWIENRKVEGMEAASIVSRIAKTARTPTSQYVNAVFEMVKNPEVKKQRGLDSTVLLTFTDLVRQSQVSNRTLHNRYPVHAFGRMSSKHNQAVEQEYIPYLERELRNAIKEADSPRIQTYILALGNIAHPKILSVLEPYLEGKERVSEFQRTLMVASLGKLAELQPKLVRSVLYKIYLNTMDSHQVRCTAVYLIMKTDPPLTMLQRMAEFTNFDTSNHVNSAVKSTIESIATLTRPETRDLANKARAASLLLTPREYDPKFSSGYIVDSASLGHLDLAYRLIVNYIGSDDSIVPRAWYIGLDTAYGGFVAPNVEMQAMYSTFDGLIDMLDGEAKKERKEKSNTEKIAEILKIEPDDPTQVEGHFLWRDKNTMKFLAFDNHTIEMIPQLAARHMSALKDGGRFNVNKLMSYEITVSFPTETGLPFIFSLDIPTLDKVSGNGKVQWNSEGGSVKGEVLLVKAMKVQGRLGFVAPFAHQQFSSGVDLNVQAQLPIKAEIDLSIPKKSAEVKVWPLAGKPQTKLLHYSLIPYTSKHDILTLRPVTTDENTQKVHTKKPETKKFTFPSDEKPMILVTKAADNLAKFEKPLEENDDIMGMLMFPWSTKEDKYEEYNVIMNLDEELREPLKLRVAVDWMPVKEETPKDSSEEWNMSPSGSSDTELSPDERRTRFMKEVGVGIQSGQSYVVDVQFDTPGVSRSRNALTVALATSNDDEKARALLFWQFNLPHMNIKYEVCAAAKAKTNRNSFMDLDEAMDATPKTEFDADIRHGRACLNGNHIEILGKAVQTEKFKKNLIELPIVKKCREQMKEGNKVLRACQHAVDAALTEDQMEVSMDLPRSLEMFVQRTVDLIQDAATDYIDMKVSNIAPENEGKNKISLKVQMSEDLEKADVSVHTPNMDVVFPKIIDDLLEGTSNILKSKNDEIIRRTPTEMTKATCVLDKNQAETFDGRAYPLNLGKCWHVAMTAYPKANPDESGESLPIPDKKRVTVMTRETDEGKEVKLHLGKKEVRMTPSGSQRKVFVDNKKVQIAKDVSHRETNRKGELEFEIIDLTNGLIRLISKKHQLEVLYDGKRIAIKAGYLFDSSVRGLCGNFDGETNDDFTSPKKCILRSPEEFQASYALVKDECEGPALENAKKLENSWCKRARTTMSNVINDFEAGRISTVRRNWGYHADEGQAGKECNTYRTNVIERDDKICFTIRPVPACAASCSMGESKEKKYQFHCMQRSAASLELQKRVEKGANPDLSQKSVSMTQSIRVPLECRA